jgi:hypothetical protein
VEGLKKVTVTVKAGTGSQNTDPIEDGTRMEFVFGIGPAGLTPFEYALADSVVGDTITLQVGSGEHDDIFGHIPIMLPQFPTEEAAMYLRVRVERVEPAAQREIIRAMAEASTCNDDCCGH